MFLFYYFEILLELLFPITFYLILGTRCYYGYFNELKTKCILKYLRFLNIYISFINSGVGISNNELIKLIVNFINSNEYRYINELKNSVISHLEKLLDNRSKPKTMFYRIDFKLLYLDFLNEFLVCLNVLDFKLLYLGFLIEFLAILNEFLDDINNRIEYGYINELKNSVISDSEKL